MSGSSQQTDRATSSSARRDDALDGVRAIAVGAVIAFHVAPQFVSGGFIGVDLFFVLSGLVITRLLIREWERSSRVTLSIFWVRRFRRIVPALALVLAANAIASPLLASQSAYRVRGDTLAGFGFVTNWTQIRWYNGYFAAAERPSSLQHLWSLAIEMQFYLGWPVIAAACFFVMQRLRPDGRFTGLGLGIALAAAAASLYLMVRVFDATGDAARVYYGTDTHLFPVLLGSALALAFTHRGTSTAPTAVASAIGIVGLVGLGIASAVISDTTTWLFKGGYGVIALSCCATVFGAMNRRAIASRLLSRRPLVWVGRRSYGIYLWHWPIIVLTDKFARGTSLLLVVAQVSATIICAALSYRYIEQPILRNGFRRSMRGSRSRGRHAAVGMTAVPGVTLGLAAALLIGGLVAVHPGRQAGIELDRGSPRQTLSLSTPTSPGTPVAASTTATSSRAPATPSSSVPPPFPPPINVSFFGDSQGMTLLLNRPDGLDKFFTLSDSTVEGCSVLTGVITSTTGYRRDLANDCGGWLADWRNSAQQIHPQIAVVELGAWDVFDIQVGGTTLKFGTPAWDQYYSSQLAMGIKALRDSGSQVALLAVPCYRPIAAGGLPLLPERGDDSRTRHVNELLTVASAGDPQHIFMVTPPAQFCSDPAIATNTAYRWDGTHFYIPGAALMFQAVAPQLLRIPQA